VKKLAQKDKKNLQDHIRYCEMAKTLGMENAILIIPDDIFFDIRAVLKCRWGCEDFHKQTIKCGTRNISFEEGMRMIKSYKNILLLHAHDATDLSRAILEIERAAFLDGYYFAFGIRHCRLCKNCAVDEGKDCPTPQKIRPCDESLGIDMYKTARNKGLPCNVLKDKDDVQNRYGFVLID
jgi:predicted metal-binding protein